MMILVFALILAVSVILALRSMSDFKLPKEIEKLVLARKLRGTIVFLGGKVKHYSSIFSSSSPSDDSK